jgi:hypothetical protein
MEPIYSRVDDTTLKVTKEVETKTEEKFYDIDFLKNQEVAILKQKNYFCEARDAELLEIRELIAQCETLGVKSKIEVALEVETAKETELI